MSKSCCVCIYFVKGIIKAESECLKFGKPAIDKTGINFYNPIKCRLDHLKCGIIARYYIELKNKKNYYLNK